MATTTTIIPPFQVGVTRLGTSAIEVSLAITHIKTFWGWMGKVITFFMVSL